VPTRCQILRLRCTKFDFGWGWAPDPTEIAYSTPTDPLAGFKGPTFNRVGEEGRRKKRGKERAGRRKKGILGKGRESSPPHSIFLDPPLI